MRYADAREQAALEIYNEAIRLAHEELHSEQFRSAVEAEKARLRSRITFKQRLAALLPFTIVWKK